MYPDIVPANYSKTVKLLTHGGQTIYGLTNRDDITIGDVLTSLLEDYKYSIPHPSDYERIEHIFLENMDGIKYDLNENVKFKDNQAEFKMRFIKDHINYDINLMENVKRKQDEDAKIIEEYEVINKKYEDVKNENIGNEIIVKVHFLTGVKQTCKINPYGTVLELKEKIKYHIGVDVNLQRLIYSGKHLNDKDILYVNGVRNNADIKCILKLRGGMFHETSGRDGKYLPIRISYYSMDETKEKNRRPKKAIIIRDKYNRAFYEYKDCD